MKRKGVWFQLTMLLFFSSYSCPPFQSYEYDPFYWVGESGSWDDPNNWSLTPDGPGGAGVPGSHDFALIITPDEKDRVIDFTDGAGGGELWIESSGSGATTLSDFGGSFFGNGHMRGSVLSPTLLVNQTNDLLIGLDIYHFDNIFYNMSADFCDRGRA